MVRWAIAAAALVVAAGCLGRSSDDGRVDDASRGADVSGARTVLTWEGRITADAAAGLPAHLEETSGVVRPYQSEGFHLVVDEPPSEMQVTLSWTAPGASMQLMVSAPWEDGIPTEYEAPWDETVPASYSERSPLCLRVPPEALKTGTWMVMLHPLVAVDATVLFEVALTGGAATILDEPAHVAAADLPFAARDKKRPEPQACEPA